MATETRVFCDLCGEEIPEEELEKSELAQSFKLDLSRLGPEEELDMFKDLCQSCTEKIYDDLQEYDWEN